MTPKPKITCAACVKQITDKKQITCTTDKCGKQYHQLCVNVSSPSSEVISTWVCPDCKRAMKKGGDNTTTPVRTSQNVTVRKNKAGSPELNLPAESSSPLEKLTEEINLLRKDIVGMRADFRVYEKKLESINGTVAGLESRLARVEENTSDLSEVTKICDGLKTQIFEQAKDLSTYESKMQLVEEQASVVAELKARNELLQDQVNSQAQAMLRNDIEIVGVTEAAGENPHHLFLTLASVAGMKPLDSDIQYVTRVGQHRSSSNLPRPLVVSFSRRGSRDQFLKLAKSKRLTTKDASIEGPVRNIYFNDRLTREHRLLFRECRIELKEKAGFKFCWTTGGQIFVKKSEGSGKGAAAINVRSRSDITRILGESKSWTSGADKTHCE